MNHDMVAMENEALISASLVRVLGNLRHLDTHAVNLIPSSEALLDILGANRIQLKQLMMHLGCSSPIEEIFNSVIAASSTSTLSSLLVECGHTTDSLAVSRGLMNLGRSLQNLTHLKVSYGYADCVALLFVDVLQKLTLLESLEFGILQVWDGILDNAETAESNASIYRKITSISRCRINCMRFYASLNGGSEQDIFKKSNSLFSFILLSCPVLETFDLNVGQVFIGGNAYGGIDLYFRGQANAQKILRRILQK